MSNLVEEFNAYRSKMNEKLIDENSKIIKRIFNLDANAYQAGTLDTPTKELMGLVASAVLRCDDCVRYHLEECYKNKMPKSAVVERLEIATLVGVTIVIPHLRKAFEYWEALEQNYN